MLVHNIPHLLLHTPVNINLTAANKISNVSQKQEPEPKANLSKTIQMMVY